MADLRLVDFKIGYTEQAFHLRVKVEDAECVWRYLSLGWSLEDIESVLFLRLASRFNNH